MTTSTGSPYRTADVAASLHEPGVLVLRAKTMGPVRQRNMLQLLAVVVALVVPIWMEWTLVAPIAFALSAAAVLVRRRSNELRVARVVLNARHGRVVVRGGGRVAPWSVPIDAIDAVTLDHSGVAAFRSGGAGLRAGQSSTNTLRARIVIRTADDTEPLTGADMAHSECIEWLSLARRFLRAHGWEPTESRGAA